jgi:sugar lactone lactonase YvrE
MKKTLSIFIYSALVLCTTCREVDSIFPNQSPVAVAGNDLSIINGVASPLDGSQSSDPDGDPLSFEWELISTPKQSKASIVPFDSVKAVFTPDLAGLYVVALRVSDNIVNDADTLLITVTQPNGAPTANAGGDGKANVGTVYQLGGSGTDPDQDPLTYSWSLTSKPAGSTTTITNPTNANATFLLDKPGSYTATLTVSDGTTSDTDDVIITTNSVNITSINPTSGQHGITVKIAGTNFSNVISDNNVQFNGMNAVVTAASYTNLDVTVPKGSGTGAVSATVNGVTDIGPTFTYILTGVVSTFSQFNAPYALTTDANGNIYIADYQSHIIRQLTPAGVLTTIAGTGQAGYLDEKSPNAMFNRPTGIAYRASNNSLYVVDNGNHCIRRIDLSSAVVSTLAGFPQAGFADGPGLQAQFNNPVGLGIDSFGNLYIGDTNNARLRRITPAGVVSTLAGNGQQGFADGTGAAAQFNGIGGVTVDNANIIYVADVLNHRIRRVTQQGVVTSLAGNGTTGFVNGTGTAARFNLPYSVACDAAGNIYVADFTNHSIRKVTPQGVVTTTAGNGVSGLVEGAGATARFNQPIGVTVAPNGNVYVADFGNQRVRQIIFE